MECAAQAALWFRQRKLPFFLSRTRVRAIKAVLASLRSAVPHSHKIPFIRENLK